MLPRRFLVLVQGRGAGARREPPGPPCRRGRTRGRWAQLGPRPAACPTGRDHSEARRSNSTVAKSLAPRHCQHRRATRHCSMRRSGCLACCCGRDCGCRCGCGRWCCREARTESRTSRCRRNRCRFVDCYCAGHSVRHCAAQHDVASAVATPPHRATALATRGRAASSRPRWRCPVAAPPRFQRPSRSCLRQRAYRCRRHRRRRRPQRRRRRMSRCGCQRAHGRTRSSLRTSRCPAVGAGPALPHRRRGWAPAAMGCSCRRRGWATTAATKTRQRLPGSRSRMTRRHHQCPWAAASTRAARASHQRGANASRGERCALILACPQTRTQTQSCSQSLRVRESGRPPKACRACPVAAA